VIDLALGHEREPRLPRPLLPLPRRGRIRTPAFANPAKLSQTNDTDHEKTQTTFMSLLFEEKRSKLPIKTKLN
jgi:hypothetical protein